MTTQFDDIRPYNDDEVRPTINRLLTDKEFLQALLRFRFPTMPETVLPLFTPLVRLYLSSKATHIESIHDLQLIVEKYMRRMIDTTISDLQISGLENLQANQPHLFISNHRDIAMDPALVNWALYHNNHKTLRIAIGDNLLTKPYVSDLMRLNKSFIVNRSATAPREKLKVAKHLSSYIHHSIVEDQANIWIAQREGRAKDGLDRTNSAVVGMLALSKPKQVALSEFIHELNITPVSISYEFDPCDEAKAKELYMKAEHGEYEKDEHEDASSIAMGITGFKGNVHIHFGEPLKGQYETNDDVVAELDDAIIRNYYVHPSNHVAYSILHGHESDEMPKTPSCHTEAITERKQTFKKRVQSCDSRWREKMLSMYANAITSQKSLSEISSEPSK